MNRRSPTACAAVVLLAALLSCSQAEQAQVQTQLAIAGETAVVVAKTQGPPLQTQLAEAVATAVVVARTVSPPLETQLAQAAATAAAEGARFAQTQAAQLATSAAPGSTQKQPAIDYIALGDSIASGHGLGDDLSTCHRSSRSYPNLVVKLLETRYDRVRPTILACSGATSGRPSEATLKEDPNKWFRNQVDAALEKISDRPTLVSITIGANDFGWSKLDLIAPHLSEPADEYLNWVDVVGSSIEAELIFQVSRLMKDRPNVAVVITQVPNPFNHNSHFFWWGFFATFGQPCRDLFGTLKCYERTEYLNGGLNVAYTNVYVALKRPAGLGIAGKIAAKFAGHESPQPQCGGDKTGPDVDTTWIQFPGDLNSNGDIPVGMKAVTGKFFGDCFHPNDKGAQAIAEEVNAVALRLGR